MKTINTILFAILLCGQLCAQEIITVRMDPDHVMGGSASQLFDSVEYIPLESSKESLFGRIDQLQVTDSLFFILDHSTKQILLFTKEGKYRSKIPMRRYIEQTNAQQINTFMVDEDKQWVIVNTSPERNTLYFFSYRGDLLKTIIGKSWANFRYLDAEHYLMTANGDITDSLSGLSANCLITDTSTSKIITPLLKAARNSIIGPGQDIDKVAGTDEAIYATQYDYSIYKIGVSGIKSQTRFIFPVAHTVPKEFFNSNYTDQFRFVTEINTTAVLGFYNIHLSQNLLTFNLNGPGLRYPSFIYSHTSQQIYSLWNVNTDSAHCFLPVVAHEGNINAADKDCFYSNIPVYYFKLMYEDNLKNRKIAYPDKMKRLYASFGNYDNPIIIRLKPKQGI